MKGSTIMLIIGLEIKRLAIIRIEGCFYHLCIAKSMLFFGYFKTILLLYSHDFIEEIVE